MKRVRLGVRYCYTRRKGLSLAGAANRKKHDDEMKSREEDASCGTATKALNCLRLD